MSNVARVGPALPAGRAAAAVGVASAAPSRRSACVAFDQVTDRIIHAAGSPAVLAAAGLFEIGWLAAGAPAHFSNGWQLAMSDVSTIAVFWMNPVLQNAENRHAGGQQVRFAQGADLSRQFAAAVRRDLAPGTQACAAHPVAVAPAARSRFDRAVKWTSQVVGSPGFFISCLVGVGAWVGAGAPMHWSNAWQLIINSATSAFELPAALALHNTKLRDDTELGALLDGEIAAIQADAQAAGYAPLVPLGPAAPVACSGALARCVNAVARAEGSAVAMGVQVGLVLAWPGLGPPMHWDDNWQLVLGTTTSIASYIFLLVLLYTHQQHIKRIGTSTAAMVGDGEAALQHANASRAALERARFATAASETGWPTRLTCTCHAIVASSAGVAIGCCGIPAWALTKLFLEFTAWMLVINSATMVAQTLSFVLIMGAHHRASATARRSLAYHATLRGALASSRDNNACKAARPFCADV